MKATQSRQFSPLRATASFLWALPYAELSVALSATVGWLLLTYAAATLLTPVMWAVGGGVYLLGLAGFRLVAVMAYRGLYELSQPDADD